jgi:hypothetical protein
LKNNLEKKLYIEVCSQEVRRDRGWWNMGIWKLKGVRRNTEQRICPMRSKEEGWSHIFRCDETKSLRNDLVDKRFASVNPEIGIRRVATKKIRTNYKNLGYI